MAHCEQGVLPLGGGGGGGGRSKSKRKTKSLFLTFVLVLVGSGVLMSLSIYAWYMHEDKSRIAKANRKLAQRSDCVPVCLCACVSVCALISVYPFALSPPGPSVSTSASQPMSLYSTHDTCNT